MKVFPPRRIVCLTEETVETLYALEADDLIVGVSGYCVRPARVRREKPRVAAFTSADTGKILNLEPDLVLTFSDLQADIVRDLVVAGIDVHAFNQRDLAGIFAMIRTVGALVDRRQAAEDYARSLEDRVDAIRRRSAALPARPKVYFEEWDDPMISGIGWVSELIEAAGGDDVFADLSRQASAVNRIVSSEQVIAAAPDVVIASWCGKKVRPERIAARPGWDGIPAVASGRLFEIKSTFILQPGPAALTDGLDQLAACLASPGRDSARV